MFQNYLDNLAILCFKSSIGIMPSAITSVTEHDGSSYTGEWKNDRRNGVGRAVFKDGSSYYGDWKDDTRNGTGTYEFRNGD